MIRYLKDEDVTNKKIIMRVDYNVPIEDGEILDTKKIDDTFPTLDYLVSEGCKIILLSHFGRVKNESDKAKNSLKPVFDYIKGLNKYNILYCSTPMGVMLDNMAHTLMPGQIILVENTRYLDLQGNLESGCDIQLSMYWAHLADYYIDDAFGSMHRNHASVTGIPQFLPSCIGLLAEKEVKNLAPVISTPERPFIVIMGGAKLEDKINLIYSLAEKADYILLGGGIANTFLAAMDIKTGQSLISKDELDEAKAILQEFPDKMILPKDVIASPTYAKDDFNIKNLNDISPDDVIGDIGPKAIMNYTKIINQAKTIFVNGTVGIYEKKPFSNGTMEIMIAVALSKAKKIVGGGDAASACKKFKLTKKMDFISTGGGATLSYIANGFLPGLDVIGTYQAKENE